MRKVLAGLLMIVGAMLLSGCGSDEVNTQEAAQSQKQINEAKNKDWQD